MIRKEDQKNDLSTHQPYALRSIADCSAIDIKHAFIIEIKNMSFLNSPVQDRASLAHNYCPEEELREE